MGIHLNIENESTFSRITKAQRIMRVEMMECHSHDKAVRIFLRFQQLTPILSPVPILTIKIKVELQQLFKTSQT